MQGDISPPGQGKTRLVIAGLGLVGLRHADAIAAVDDTDLVAVADPSDAAIEAARSRGIAHYDTLERAIQHEQPDGIILATPTPLHVEQAETCIDAGIAVLVEKPLSDDLVAAERLVSHAEAAKVPVLVGHHRRHNPLIQKAKQIIADGRIGQVRAVQATCWFYKPDHYFDVAPWRTRKGAGPISVNLVHDIDLIRHLCGEVVSVQAQAAPSLRGFENEDVASALLRLDNNALVSITVSDSIVAPWSWEMTSKEYPVYPVTTESAYLIGGSHGSLSVPDLKLWAHEAERDWWTPISAEHVAAQTLDPLVNQIRNFVGVIAGETEALVTGAEGLRTLRIIDAIEKAAQSGETIHL